MLSSPGIGCPNRSHHFSQTELSGQWAWVTAGSGSLRGGDTLHPSLCARAKAVWKWHLGVFHCEQLSGVYRGHLPALPVSDGRGGGSSVTSGPSPHMCQCCFTVTITCLNENQQKISVTLQMYKQLQYCGHYSINMNLLLALSIPMLFHTLLACFEPGRTLWLQCDYSEYRVEFC